MASPPNETPWPAPDAVLEQLEKVLSSQLFKGSQRSAKLLRFLVQQTVGGQQDGLKEYTVGTKALGKGHSFDPRTDPTVRSEASRLRTRLDKYYATEGLADSVVIVLPKGRYVPRFESRTTPPGGTQSIAEERPRPALGLRIPLVILASTIVVAIALISYWQIALRATLPGVVAQRATAADAASAVSIAVLPFLNLSGDATQEFFSDGMTEEITSALAMVPDLKVVARTSAFQFKGENNDIRAVGQALNATHLVGGSVRKDGNRVRISAQLIEAGSGTHLWSENYDRQLGDIFTTQEEIARTIVGSLMAPLGLAPGERLVSNRSIDPDSYQQFLRARALGFRGVGALRAIPLLEPLVARNPDYAPAWAQLAQLYGLTPNFSRNRPLEELRRVMKEVVPKADAAGRRAIQLDPNLAVGYAVLARMQLIQGRLLAAEELYSKALALDPNSPSALGGYSNLLAIVGRLKEAIAMKYQVLALEPALPGSTEDTAQLLWVTGQNDAAIALLKDLPSSNQGIAIDLAKIYAAMGRYKEAADFLQGMTRTPGANLSAEMLAAGVRLMRSAPAETAAPQSLPGLGTLGFIYLYVGAPLRAFEPIEEWGEAGFYVTGGADNAFLWHPSYAAVRKSERFKTFMRKAGYVEYWRVKGWPAFCHPTTADDFACD